jgi:zinc D-Ala-D-Ala carboxypeptidase
MNLSKHFSLSEFTKSQTAIRRGINNKPTLAHRLAMGALCNAVLEPVRAHFGKPVRISSGYRSKALNAAVGGSNTSQHSLGEAADIEIDGVDNRRLAKWIEANCPFDQIILEGAKRGDPNAGWVHVSIGPRNRRETLTATFKGGKAVYTAGIA